MLIYFIKKFISNSTWDLVSTFHRIIKYLGFPFGNVFSLVPETKIYEILWFWEENLGNEKILKKTKHFYKIPCKLSDSCPPDFLFCHFITCYAQHTGINIGIGWGWSSLNCFIFLSFYCLNSSVGSVNFASFVLLFSLCSAENNRMEP